MAKKGSTKSKTVYRTAKAKARRKSKPVIHLLPDIAELGILYPALTSAPQPTIAAYVSSKIKGEGTAPVGDYIANTVSNYKENIVPVIGLGIAGIVLKWVGKKTGLSRVGTKEVKIL